MSLSLDELLSNRIGVGKAQLGPILACAFTWGAEGSEFLVIGFTNPVI